MEATQSEITAIEDALRTAAEEPEAPTPPTESAAAQPPPEEVEEPKPAAEFPLEEPPDMEENTPHIVATETPPTLELPKGRMKKSEIISKILEASSYIGREEPDESKLRQRKAADLRANLEALRKLVEEKNKLVAALHKLIESGVKYNGEEPETLSIEQLKKELAKQMTKGVENGVDPKSPVQLLQCDPGEFLFFLNIGVCTTGELIARHFHFPYLDGWANEVRNQHDILKEALTEIYAENADWLAPMLSATTRWALIMFMSATKVIAQNYSIQRNGGIIREGGNPQVGGSFGAGPAGTH